MYRPNARSPSLTSQESYSAVIITDLIADVPVNLEADQGNKKKMKDETNLAFDGQLDGDVKNSVKNDLDSPKANGAGISRGVILNAMQFGQNDLKNKIVEKPMQMTAPLPAPTVTQPTSEPKGFKDMSIQRKIAFGFSFLPSILFVLCFAVILPCNVPKPCVEESWIAIFNNTEATSRLELSGNIKIAALKDGESILLELNKDSGEWNEIKLENSSSYLKCGKVMYKNRTDCIVMDGSGNIFTFSDSQSKKLWSPFSETEELISHPTILRVCDDEMEDIVVAVSNANVKILYSGNKISNFALSHCDSVPMKFMHWTTSDSQNVVFVCDKAGEDKLIKVPKSSWCTFPNFQEERPSVLQTGPLNSIKNSVIHPLEDHGLVLWTENEAYVLQQNGTIFWKISNLSQPEENRFILYGNFLDGHKLLAFVSSGLSYGFKATLVDPSNGNIVKVVNHQDIEATEVKHSQGKKRDFVLLLLKKSKVADDTLTTALSQINGISTTIISLISNEVVNEATPNPTVEELAILDFDSDAIDTVAELKDIKDPNHKSSMTVTSDKEGILSVYHLSTTSNLHWKTTEVRNIKIANWDKTTKSKCLGN